MYQEEYPQFYISDELKVAMCLPTPPLEPDKPTPIEKLPPKYSELLDNLTGVGIFLVLFFIALGIGNLVNDDFAWFLFLTFIGFIVFFYKLIKSVIELKNYQKKFDEHREREKRYEVAVSSYEKAYPLYLREKEKYDELMSTLNTTHAICEYQLKLRQDYLKEKKSKDRHRWFFDFEGPVKNTKIGRGEFFFRDFLLKAKEKQLIPEDFEFYFDTIVEVSSLSITSKVSFFFPDVLVLTPRGLMIDIEIDEPYSSDSKKPIHCIHSVNNRDSSRNRYFTRYNCNVVRFSERQIIKYPETCLKIILSFDDIAGMPREINLPTDFIEKSWDEKDAIKMAESNYRETY